jgi:beta-hydroxylase
MKMSGFIDDFALYPRAYALATILSGAANTIADEGQRAIDANAFHDWPEPINKGGWQVLGHKWKGEMLPQWDKFLAGRIAMLSDSIINCGYSLMLPGAEITPHVGYTDDVLRMHLGLIVPQGDCALIVGGQTRAWKKGGIMFFDDRVEHSAHNLTDSPRLILLLDIARDKAGFKGVGTKTA